MEYYSTYGIVVLLLHQCFAQDVTDQVTNKDTQNAIQELIKKINDISSQSFSNDDTRLEMFKKIEGKLKRAAKSLGKKGERYINLIMKGIKAKSLNEIYSNNKTQVKVPSNVYNTSKFGKINNIIDYSLITKENTKNQVDDEKIKSSDRIPEKLNSNRKNEPNNEDSNKNDDFISTEHLRRMNVISNGSEGILRYENIQDTSTEPSVQILTPLYECESSLDKICLNIKQMRELKCHFDDTVVSIEKLCDGVTDCIDRTDEKFCASQATERIQNANQILHQADKSFQLKCFPNITKDSTMTSQIIILRSVLQAQQEFVEKYKYFDPSLIPDSGSLRGEGTVKKAVNEISLIISSLALALDAELCSRRVKTGEEFIARKFNDLLIEDFDKVMDEVETPPKSCVCKEGRCENITTCTDGCKRICWQKHTLTRWRCLSINETENVPLSVICDGKFDCFDQSDEKDCATGISFAKFEAHNNFKEILSSLSLKVTSKEYDFIRNMLLSLYRIIEDLQKFCMASEPDLKKIRALRNRCFSTLSSIYSETLTKSSFLYQKSEVYVFLLSLNENIVNALKASHTGNRRIIPNDRCFCTNGRCSMAICSRNCLRSCIAEPWLTRYFCENSFNKSVSLDDICNGKSNCPGEDDETHCEKDICRRHHLTLLRHNLQKIGKKQEGTSMGELLTTWKTKVSSTLLIAENSYRPNPHTMRDIIRDILSDLVITYGAVKDFRRDNEYALDEFTNIARYIMNFLRSCSH